MVVEILGGGFSQAPLSNIKKIGVIVMAEENQLVRLSVRVSKENNDYLDKKSMQTGISKSALVQIAVEQYRQQAEAVSAMNNMEVLFEQLGKIQDEIEDLKKW
jgi:predicted DNA-binding protein